MTPDWLTYLQGNADVALRVALAALLGGLFGLERELKGHEAGLRTNILISVAACLFTYLGIEAFPILGEAGRDPARVAAQIVSGVGFLGAGTLLQTRNKVRGLTTAATIWLVSAVGMAVGAGDYFIAVFSTLLALGVLSLLSPISRAIKAKALRQYQREQAVKQIKKLSNEPEAKLEEGEGEENDWEDRDYD